MPERWPSMRSMARWVLPVLVGPRTAVIRPAEATVMPSRSAWILPNASGAWAVPPRGANDAILQNNPMH